MYGKGEDDADDDVPVPSIVGTGLGVCLVGSCRVGSSSSVEDSDKDEDEDEEVSCTSGKLCAGGRSIFVYLTIRQLDPPQAMLSLLAAAYRCGCSYSFSFFLLLCCGC